MAQYIIRRLLALIPVWIGVSIVVFMLIRMIPGDPVTVMLGERRASRISSGSPREWGSTGPIYIQYIEWMGRVLRGDLGESIFDYTPVMSELKQRLPATIEMVLVAMFIGVHRRRRHRHPLRRPTEHVDRHERHVCRADRRVDADLLAGAHAHLCAGRQPPHLSAERAARRRPGS